MTGKEEHACSSYIFGKDRDQTDSVITYNEFIYAYEEPDYATNYDPIGNSRRYRFNWSLELKAAYTCILRRPTWELKAAYTSSLRPLAR